MKKCLTIILLFLSVYAFSQKLTIDKLRCEYLENPVGLDIPEPRLSWQIKVGTELKDIIQESYQLQVVTDKPGFTEKKSIAWDSKKVKSGQSVNIIYDGKTLMPRTRYYWRVKVWDNQGRESAWSTPAYWETGLTDSTLWKASWIVADIPEDTKIDQPAPFFRKGFNANKNIKSARLYITSRGLYSAFINGKPVTDQIFTPGWTSFKKRIQYQGYDVSNLIEKGENVAGVELADGWFRGPLAGSRGKTFYGDKLALLYQLEIEYTNGEKQLVVSDVTWKSKLGPVRLSSIYDGETYDANYEIEGWKNPGFEAKDWHNVIVFDYPKSTIVPSVGSPVKRIEEIKPLEKIITPKGELVFDFGQNLVGRVKFKLKGNKNDTITILHAELLDQEGNFYTENLRKAKQKIEYIFKNDEEVTYEPVFTFQGFRYIKIEKYDGNIGMNDLTAVVIHSDMEPAGYFECSDSMINQLQSNIRWGQKGNFLDVPTDCPQRDERLGWTGDAQVFASTSIFNYNTAPFFNKWLKDLKADQLENGSVGDVVPDVRSGRGGSTGWGDAATIIPYTMYLKYNDKRILEEQYESMKSWVSFLHNLADDDLIIREGRHYGDWLFFIHPTNWNDKPGFTDKDLISTAFFAHSTKIMEQTAEIIGNKNDVEKYNALYDSIKTAFQHEFMTPSGRLSPNSQTAYVLSLYFGLIPYEYKTNAVNYLVKNIEDRGFHLSTGFLGTPYICHVLSDNGRTDVAYKLLLQEKYPSWLYPITMGATTIWERWDGIKPDGSFQTERMNSFNHYAYGAVGDWMYSVVAGIRVDENNPGYQHIVIKPEPDVFSYAKAGYESMYGKIESSWEKEGNQFNLSVTIPPNTSATIYLPYSNKIENVGSGKYEYQYAYE